MRYYTVIKMKELGLYVSTWENVENITSNGKSLVPFTCSLVPFIKV